MQELFDCMKDAKEYGSILTVPGLDFDSLRQFARNKVAEIDQVDWESNDLQKQLSQVLTLIDVAEVLARRYQVVCTNPPYMGSSGMGAALSSFVKKYYPDSKSDMSTVFMEKTMKMCAQNGYMTMINIPVWMFLSSHEKLRSNLLQNNTLVNMVHPGRGIFGSDFGTTSFVFKKGLVDGYQGSYRRLFDQQGEVKSPEEREQAMLAGKDRYTAQQSNFVKIPGSPVAYWVSEQFIRNFENRRLSDISRARRGLETGNNEKYLKYWFEVNLNDIAFDCKSIEDFDKSWIPHNKGGNYRCWYGNNEYVVWFKNEGKDIRKSGTLNGYDVYMLEGITWTALTIAKNSFRYTPPGHTFDSNKGPLIVDNGDNVLFYLLGLFNSKVTYQIIRVINPSLSLQNGDMDKLPIIIDKTRKATIDEIVKSNVDISKKDWDAFETSWDFQRHPLV